MGMQEFRVWPGIQTKCQSTWQASQKHIQGTDQAWPRLLVPSLRHPSLKVKFIILIFLIWVVWLLQPNVIHKGSPDQTEWLINFPTSHPSSPSSTSLPSARGAYVFHEHTLLWSLAEAQPPILRAWPLRSLQRAALLGSQHTGPLADGRSTEQPLVPDAPHCAWLLGSWEGCLGSAFSTSVGLGSNLISYSDSQGLWYKERGQTVEIDMKGGIKAGWNGRNTCALGERDPGSPTTLGKWQHLPASTPYLWSQLKQILLQRSIMQIIATISITLPRALYRIPDSLNSIQSVGRKELPIPSTCCV